MPSTIYETCPEGYSLSQCAYECGPTHQIYETEEGYRCRDCSGSDALDLDCFGEVRCAIHSDPCPGCYSGGPDADDD